MIDTMVLFAETTLPRLELVLRPHRPEIILSKASKPKVTGRTIAPSVEIRTFPAYPVTSSPERLRSLARQLEIAATTLEKALVGQYPFVDRPK